MGGGGAARAETDGSAARPHASRPQCHAVTHFFFPCSCEAAAHAPCDAWHRQVCWQHRVAYLFSLP